MYRPSKGNIADALFRLNQLNPKDPSSEKEDLVRFVAQESIPVSLTPWEIEREYENDPELVSLHFVYQLRWLVKVQDANLCKCEEWTVYHRKTSAVGS